MFDYKRYVDEYKPQTKQYQIIYADPPWQYGDKVLNNGHGKQFDSLQDYHYPTMSTKELNQLPIAKLAADNCALFIWTTDSHIPDCLEVIKAWGFEYKTVAFCWLKTAQWNILTRSNLGKWTQKNVELCLFATKGTMAKYLKDRSIHQLIEYPRSVHSRKPPEARIRIEKMFGDLPRLELFARQKAEGWHSWGNQVESSLSLSLLEEVAHD
jgi:site-specific DNA-methyltransferase (adenine-specific)